MLRPYTLPALVALLSITGHYCSAGMIVNAGGVGDFNYSWAPLNGTNPQFDTDAYRNNVERIYEFYAPSSTYYSYVCVPTRVTNGSIEWHYQTDAGTMFADDVQVTYQVNLFSTGSWGVNGFWSTDGTNYHQFCYEGRGVHHTTLKTVSLKDSGYAGGQDLYVKFNLSKAGGFSYMYDAVQLFRQGSPNPTTTTPSYVVSGTIFNPIPEPSAFILISMATVVGMGLRWKMICHTGNLRG